MVQIRFISHENLDIMIEAISRIIAIIAVGILATWLCFGCSKPQEFHQVRWVNCATNQVYVSHEGLPTNLQGNVVFGMRDDGVMVWRLP
jgi:hypothetical protein